MRVMGIYGPFGNDYEIAFGIREHTVIEYDGTRSADDEHRNHFGSDLGHAAINATSSLTGWEHYEVTDADSLISALQGSENFDAVVIRPGKIETNEVLRMIGAAHVAGAAIALVKDPSRARYFLPSGTLDIIDSAMIDQIPGQHWPLPPLTDWFKGLDERLTVQA